MKNTRKNIAARICTIVNS
ncbi:hypothetical protein J4221_04910 [Candidatus Pacearchaeota archaeon]|nr:hypothetical protein [Candidatus Pacearchaeota archaeon]